MILISQFFLCDISCNGVVSYRIISFVIKWYLVGCRVDVNLINMYEGQLEPKSWLLISRADTAESVERLPGLTLWGSSMHDRSQSWARPMPIHKYVDNNGSAAMLVTKRSAGVAPKMNLRIPLHAGNKAKKPRGSTLGLKPGADATRSPKQKYQQSHKKDWCPSKFKKR